MEARIQYRPAVITRKTKEELVEIISNQYSWVREIRPDGHVIQGWRTRDGQNLLVVQFSRIRRKSKVVPLTVPDPRFPQKKHKHEQIREGRWDALIYLIPVSDVQEFLQMPRTFHIRMADRVTKIH